MEDHYKHPVDEKKVRFRINLLGAKSEGRYWTILITIISFIISASLSFFSSAIMAGASILAAICVVLLIITVSIIFDIIGTAVTAADEAPFHAMASRKLYGAKEAIKLVRNADKVSNFCNDVVGDICSILSGSASLLIIVDIAGSYNAAETSLAGIVVTGLVASATVGGKALGKTMAIQNSNFFVYKVSVILKFLFGRIIQKNTKKKR